MDEELRPRPAGGEATPEAPLSTRPRIEFDEINLPEVLDKTQEALAACGAAANTPVNEKVPNVANISMIANDRPRSPTRLTRNAFFAATAAVGL